MGFFGKILNGLGFYSDEDLKELQEKKLQKTNQTLQQTSSQTLLQPSTQNSQQMPLKTVTLFTPTTQKDVVEIVNLLKTGISARIDLKMFSGEDLIRAIDFLQGASYALNLEPIFENGTTILLKGKL